MMTINGGNVNRKYGTKKFLENFRIRTYVNGKFLLVFLLDECINNNYCYEDSISVATIYLHIYKLNICSMRKSDKSSKEVLHY